MSSFGYGGILEQLANTTAAAGTTTLINTSKQIQVLTTSGGNGQTYTLPDATTMVVGQKFEFYNTSAGILTINKNGGTLLLTVASGLSAFVKLTVNGTTAGTWVELAASSGSGSSTAPTSQIFSSTGTQTGTLFSVSSGNAISGDTYTNNSNTFTVLANGGASAFGSLLFTSGTGTTSGSTLTRASGTGSATLTFSTKQSMATYTRPTAPTPLYLRVRLIGGGGGGSGGGSTSGSFGLFSTFGSALLQGSGANGGTLTGNGGAGGAASLGTITTGIAITGASADGAGGPNSSRGARGASSPFGGAGLGAAGAAGSSVHGDGSAGVNGTGSGGGGGGGNSANAGGSGGGAGGYVDAIITSPASTYFYVVGTGGSAGTGPSNGGAGASGIVIVDEYYQ